MARLQDEEAERRAFIAVPYDAEIHKLNPFLGDNQTAQAEFIRRDPELAKFYKAEAEPATIAVFGHHRNLTIEARLYKDPAAASVLKVAREINRQWLDQDRATAMEQRKAAEEQIARLQSQIA